MFRYKQYVRIMQQTFILSNCLMPSEQFFGYIIARESYILIKIIMILY
jgi:hypothetical protein